MTLEREADQTIEIESGVEMTRGVGVDVDLSTLDTAAGDVRDFREALRRMLGIGKDTPPHVDADWRDGWPALADLGVTALCVAEERGGVGLRADVAVAAAMEMGAALHGAPFAALAASAHALSRIADPPWGDDLLAGLLSGEMVCAFGYLRRGELVAHLVEGAVGADAVLLADESSRLILLQERGEWDTAPSRHAFDVTRSCGDVRLEPGAGRQLAIDHSPGLLHRLLLCADAVGGVQHMLERTVHYALQRQAFGHPLGAMQAVQHRLVEHAVKARGMAMLVDEAARLLDDDDGARMVAMAEVSVSSGAGHILHDLLQLTGAIGFSWEYGLHFYERRAHTSARLAANPRAGIRSLARLEGWSDAG